MRVPHRRTFRRAAGHQRQRRHSACNGRQPFRSPCHVPPACRASRAHLTQS
ncbi:hypothetical protein W91_1163 [Bifidobacterium animalis subsp. lactis Bi-07]|nr:hypothetical protein W91_1163 [Bifidobacterium animalis subsp. lactis Bi-07]